MPAKSLTVTQLVRKMRNLLEIEIGEVWIEGEVSNLRRQSSGHYYFTLKDDGAQMSCAMFSAKRRVGSSFVTDGAKVRAFVDVTIYEARGQAQLVVKKVEQLGAGDLQARFEALKRKLHAEGLFDPAGKKALPYFPQKIGIVTSPSGAALQDMMNVLGRRAPWLTVVLCPAPVQGAGAERKIASGIASLDARGDIDVIIVGRGGGSLEDLWNFNEEVVARAIHACDTPVISAVGHEIDYTISDFAADQRAPTPSAAAEIVTPAHNELTRTIDARAQQLTGRIHQKLARLRERIELTAGRTIERAPGRILREKAQRLDALTEALPEAIDSQLRETRHHLDQLALRLSALRPDALLAQMQQSLEQLEKQLGRAAHGRIDRRKLEVDRYAAVLKTLGPDATLARGYSMTFGPDGKIIKERATVAKGARLTTRVSDGEITSEVID